MRLLSEVPYQAAAQLEFADGVVRRFKLDLFAIAVAESVSRKPFRELLGPFHSEDLQAWLYAALLRDALERGEAWTPDRAAALVSDGDRVAVLNVVRDALMAAMVPDQSGKLAGPREEKQTAPWSWENAIWEAAAMGIVPEQFWRMTLLEFQLYQHAFYAARREQCRFEAAMTANLMNCWLKRPVTAEQLLGISQTSGKWASQMTPEEKNAMRERMRQSLHRPVSEVQK